MNLIEDVRRALTFQDTKQVPTVEQQVSIDDTLVDDDYCKVCKTKLEREFASLEHIKSMDHKSKMGEYTSFTNVQQNISKAMQRWENDINYFKLLPQERSEAENVLIIKVQDHIRLIESIYTSLSHLLKYSFSILVANLFSLHLRRVVVSVSHVVGSPFPTNHSWRIVGVMR